MLTGQAVTIADSGTIYSLCFCLPDVFGANFLYYINIVRSAKIVNI